MSMEKNHSLVSAVACMSSNLKCRKTFFFFFYFKYLYLFSIFCSSILSWFLSPFPGCCLKSFYEIKHICIFTIYLSLWVLSFSAVFFIFLCVVHYSFFEDDLCLENPKFMNIFIRILCPLLWVASCTAVRQF